MSQQVKFLGETMRETVADLWRKQHGTEPPAWLISPTAVPNGAAEPMKEEK